MSRLLRAAAGALLLLACDRTTLENGTRSARPSTAQAAPVMSAQTLVARPVRAKSPLAEGSTSAASEIVPLEPARAANPTDRPDRLSAEMLLEAHFDWPNQPRTLRLVGAGSGEATAILARTRQAVSIALQGDGRLQLEFLTPAFPLPEGTKIQSRFANFGHFLVWPDSARYRVLPPGTVRALLRERRVDATPILSVQPTRRAADARFGLPTEELVFEAALGKLTLRVAKAEEAGRGGPLLCRLLLEFVGIAPQSESCPVGRVPLVARFDFGSGAALLFTVDNVTRRAEALRRLEVPPEGSELVTRDLPALTPVYLTAAERALTGRGGESGWMRVSNPSPYAAFLLLEGVPMATLAPYSEQTLSALRAGTYSVGLRSLFADEVRKPSAMATSPGNPEADAKAHDSGTQ